MPSVTILLLMYSFKILFTPLDIKHFCIVKYRYSLFPGNFNILVVLELALLVVRFVETANSHRYLFCLYFRIAQKRADGVAAEVNKKFSQMDSKKITKKEKDDR